LIAQKYDRTAHGAPGRPRTAGKIETLVVRMAEENRDWGYRRIQGALSNLGHELARSTIAQILERHGIEPVPERIRKTTWKEFLSQHWDLIVATDFFTVEVWTRRGLQRFMVLFFIELPTRKVQIAGMASIANGLWMSQIARNLTDAEQGILTGMRYPDALGGVSATIEYAVGVLRVPEVIVCGHTDCGVMRGALHPEALQAYPNVIAWLRYARVEHREAEPSAEFLLTLAENNVVAQLKNLRSHPTVASRLEQGDLALHGWVYHIGPGTVTAYNEASQKFGTTASM
jgi:hypothetical protein